MQAIVDVHFSVRCQAPIPADHGYLLYSALSRQLPELHRENGIAVHPLTGHLIGARQLQLDDRSSLTLRLSADQVTKVLSLAGKQLNLADRLLRVGVPRVKGLIPATTLRSRLVSTKNGQDRDRFEAELRRQLDLLQVSNEIAITVGKRRTFRVRDKEIVGHEVLLEGLSAVESVAVQSHGLGGRRHMGCGVFVGVKEPE